VSRWRLPNNLEREIMEEKEIIGLILILLFYIVCMAIIGPLFTIWSLNTLFGLEIAYSFKNWVAVVWLTLVLYSVKFNSKSN
jgi:hypothetical protein